MKFDIWKECPKVPLPSVLLTVVDNRGKTVPTAPSGHKLIATNCVRNENLYPVYEKIRYLSEETYRTWFRAHPEPGDIIFVCKGTPGRVCLVPDPIDFCIAQDMVALRADPKIVYNKYLLAVLRSFQIQEQILSTSVGDVIPHFKKSFFDQIMIPIPNMDIQKSIGDFYYTISELKIKELRQGICDANSELCSPSIKSEYIIHDGDIIFSWSGSLLVDIWCGGTCGLNQHLFKVTSNNYDKWFYYLWTAHHLDRFIAVAADKATTMGHIKREELEKAEVIIPSKCDYKRIRTLIKPLFDLIISNRIENRKLTALRNTLLPKIMSGEIDVANIQL